ncbi:MAG: cation diffusion facilitator family transporter [Pseudanabaenaceae cyanobacterium]
MPQTYAWLSIAAAVCTMALKTSGYLLTGSVALLSDALESGVNLLAAGVTLWLLRVAAQPADAEHPFGHSKFEYLASAVEGGGIGMAAVGIALTAWGRLHQPVALPALTEGIALTVLATAINGGTAWILWRAGRRLRSIALRADAHHLLTDVWTSVGGVLGLGIIHYTGWLWVDPVIALAMALHIAVVSYHLLQETVAGLVDTALPPTDLALLQTVLTDYTAQGLQFHALRTRRAGRRRFVSVHVLVPGAWSVQKGHDLCDRLEQTIAQALPGTAVLTHLEPLEDPASWQDEDLDREDNLISTT